MEGATPGGGDLMQSLAASLADGAGRFDENQRTKRLTAAQVERTRRSKVLAGLVEKHLFWVALALLVSFPSYCIV